MKKKKTIISDPPKPWWPGDSRVEPYMVPIAEALKRNGLESGSKQFVDIYNRAYEAVYKAIIENSHISKR